MNKVEKVGRAVLADLMDRQGYQQALEDLDDDVGKEIQQAIGRAAIEALREPTEGMIAAGAEVEGYCQGEQTVGDRIGEGPAKYCFQAMIDEALK